MTSLIARRRSPLATAALVVAALLAVGAAYGLVAGSTRAQAAPTSATSQQVEQGRQLFLEGCASCHGLNAEGGFQPDGTVAGPSLIGVGAAAVNFQVGSGRMPLAAPGAQAPKKNPDYTEEEIAALAAYVASLAPGPAIPTDEQVDYTQVSDAELALGGALFRANCAACHNFAGEGGALTNGKRAPNLTAATPRQMYEAMITGPGSMPVFPDSTITPAQKRAIIAYIKTIDEGRAQGGLPLGALGPVTEGLMFWIVGIGALIGVAVWIGAKVR